MTRDTLEPTVRDGLHRFADALAVDLEADWQKVLDRGADRRPDGAAVALPLRAGSLQGLNRKPLLLAGVAAAVAVVVAVGVLTLGSRPAAGTPALPEPLPFTHGRHEGAVALLRQAARLQDTATERRGPIRYAKTQNYALQTDIARHTSSTTVETTIREVWMTADGTGLAKIARQDTTRAGVPIGPPHAETTDGNWQDTNTALPTRLSALRAALVDPHASGGEAELILAQRIMAHLAQGTTTAAQNASLYRLLAALPGLFDAGTVTDPNGRTGRAVGVPTGYFDARSSCAHSPANDLTPAALAARHALGTGTSYLLLDRATGRPLAVEVVDTPSPPCALGLPAGPTIEQYAMILQAGRVRTIGKRTP